MENFTINLDALRRAKQKNIIKLARWKRHLRRGGVNDEENKKAGGIVLQSKGRIFFVNRNQGVDYWRGGDCGMYCLFTCTLYVKTGKGRDQYGDEPVQ